MGGVLGSFRAFQGNFKQPRQFLPVGTWEGSKFGKIVTLKIFWWGNVPVFFLVSYWPKRAPLVQFKPNWRWCFWEKSTFLHTLFGPKTAFSWLRWAPFDPKPQKLSGTICFNPKHCIPGLKLVSKQKWQFWVRQTPPKPPQGGSKMAVMHLSQSSVDN